jgi:tRNA threonylcarbamoyladenosine biosynthesis protein TsaB
MTKILSLDTSARSCSVGLSESETCILEITVNMQQTHSVHLLGCIHRALELTRFRVEDLDLICVVIGPGSFTGLRIGMSVAKGIASAADKSIVGVSSLEALAYQAVSCCLPVCAMMDARKKEVYAGRFERRGDHLRPIAPEVVTSPESYVESINDPCMFIGDGAQLYRGLILEAKGNSAIFADPAQNVIRASTVGRLGMMRAISKGPEDPGPLVPVYIRKSDAQLKRQQI